MQRIPAPNIAPRWLPKHRLIGHPVPARVAPWLFDSGSLTSRLIAHCAGRFHVRVLSQGWQRPTREETRRLGMRAGRVALVREVLLYCDETPLVFARSVIPRRTLTGRQKYLGALGNRPLGAALFSDPSMRRDELEVACLRGAVALYPALGSVDISGECVWGRRSVFRVGGKPLLVAEMFLPRLLADDVPP